MTTQVPLLSPHSQYFDNSGNPLSGGKVYTYSAGTSTPKSTYTDAAGGTPNANPTILDSAGRAAIWGSGAYKVVVTDSAGNTMSTDDNYTAFNASSTSAFSDASFTLQDDGDATKQVMFQLSGITTGSTTTLTVPNGSSTIATTTGTQTLTNKLLSDSTTFIVDDGDATKKIAFQASGITTGTTRTITVPDASGTLGYISDYQAFTSSGTWTKPSGLTGTEMVLVQIWAGGGSGASSASGSAASGAGGGAYNEIKLLASQCGATETVTIGAGGTAKTAAAGDGNDGGSSTFGSLGTAYGGFKGSSSSVGGGGGGILTGVRSGSAGGAAQGGAGGSGGPGGTSIFGGGGGGSGTNAQLPAGGASIWGGGGGGGIGANTGTAANATGGASIWGGGGGGGSGTTTASGAGGASQYGGAGGAGAIDGAAATAGTQPAGGGGGSENGVSGAGGAGKIIVRVFR